MHQFSFNPLMTTSGLVHPVQHDPACLPRGWSATHFLGATPLDILLYKIHFSQDLPQFLWESGLIHHPSVLAMLAQRFPGWATAACGTPGFGRASHFGAGFGNPLMSLGFGNPLLSSQIGSFGNPLALGQFAAGFENPSMMSHLGGSTNPLAFGQFGTGFGNPLALSQIGNPLMTSRYGVDPLGLSQFGSISQVAPMTLGGFGGLTGGLLGSPLALSHRLSPFGGVSNTLQHPVLNIIGTLRGPRQSDRLLNCAQTGCALPPALVQQLLAVDRQQDWIMALTLERLVQLMASLILAAHGNLVGGRALF